MHRSAWTMIALLLTVPTMTSAFGNAKVVQGAEQQGTAPTAKAGGQETSTPPSRPNPDSSGVYHAGAGVTAPKVIYSSVDPEFSDKARKKKLGGTCIIGMVVDTAGTPQGVHVVQSLAQSVAPKLRSAAQSLDEKAVEAVKQYKFKPATYQGNAVPYDLKIEINFRIY